MNVNSGFRTGTLVAVAVSAALGRGQVAVAQEAAAPDRWDFEVELGGSVFFGNRPQTQFTAKSEVASAYDPVESTTQFEFTYGVSEDNEGVTSVSRRSWTLGNTVGFLPQGVWHPFVEGAVQSSFERGIDLRYESGVGVKYDRESDRDNRIEFSVALLGERTYPREEPGEPAAITTLARWSSTMRIRRTFVDDRISIDLRGEYKPVFDAFGNYTWTSQNAFTLSLTEVIGLRLNTKLQYDSRAVSRGARTNRDGQVQLALVAEF